MDEWHFPDDARQMLLSPCARAEIRMLGHKETGGAGTFSMKLLPVSVLTAERSCYAGCVKDPCDVSVERYL